MGEQKVAFKKARQACLDFLTDVNTLQLDKEGPYLQQGKVEFPLTGRTLNRDKGSTANSLSNVGLANLVEASFKEISFKTGSFGTPAFTRYVESRTETAKS